MKNLILFFFIFIFISCSGDNSPFWTKSLETLPQIKGYNSAGIFSLNNKLYSQHCDAHGNQLWLKYDDLTHTWSKVKYNSLGCLESKYSTGPDNN